MIRKSYLIYYIIYQYLIFGYLTQETYIHHDCKLPMHQRIVYNENIYDVDKKACAQNFNMYSFNVEKNICENNMSKGCPSNLNSFNNYYTCMNFCIRSEKPQSNCIKLINFTNQCANFERDYFKWYSNGRQCIQFTENQCLFNGNHFQNRYQCQSICAEYFDSTQKSHIINLNSARKSWCFEKYHFQVGSTCLNREIFDITSAENIKSNRFYFDLLQNKCLLAKPDACTYNGNSFSTIEECIYDCLPSKFECVECETFKFRKMKINCPKTSLVNLECSIRYGTANLTALKEEVNRIRTNSTYKLEFNLIFFITLLILFESCLLKYMY